MEEIQWRRRPQAGGARRFVVAGLGATILVGAIGAALLTGSGAAPLILAALTLGLAVAAWLQASAARRTAEASSETLEALTNRLLELERQLAGGGPSETAGEVNPAERATQRTPPHQTSDGARAGPGHRSRWDEPSPSVPQRRSVSPASSTEPGQPDPCLLPLVRQASSVAAGMDLVGMADVVRAFDAGAIELHLQPIVSLPHRAVRFYEALARLRISDETLLLPGEFLPTLHELGHAAAFDRRMFAHAIAVARHLKAWGSEAIVGLNLSPRSVSEPGFLRSLGRVADEAPDVTGRIVLELSQRCWRTLDGERAGALAALRDRGIPLALDRATDLRLDPLALADRGVRFAKISGDLLTGREQEADIETDDLAAVLRRAGIKLVADRVEREEIVPRLIEIGVPLAQGFVFAPPRAVRPEVLGLSDGAAPPDNSRSSSGGRRAD